MYYNVILVGICTAFIFTATYGQGEEARGRLVSHVLISVSVCCLFSLSSWTSSTAVHFVDVLALAIKAKEEWDLLTCIGEIDSTTEGRHCSDLVSR